MKTLLYILGALYIICAILAYMFMSSLTNNTNASLLDHIKLFLFALAIPFVLIYVNFFKKQPYLPPKPEDPDKKKRRKKNHE